MITSDRPAHAGSSRTDSDKCLSAERTKIPLTHKPAWRMSRSSLFVFGHSDGEQLISPGAMSLFPVKQETAGTTYDGRFMYYAVLKVDSC